jgi:hypothetical protein
MSNLKTKPQQIRFSAENFATEKTKIPSTSGIYGLYKIVQFEGQEIALCLYVGKAENLSHRWSNHEKLSKLEEDQLYELRLFFFEPSELLLEEHNYISYASPIWNVQAGNTGVIKKESDLVEKQREQIEIVFDRLLLLSLAFHQVSTLFLTRVNYKDLNYLEHISLTAFLAKLGNFLDPFMQRESDLEAFIEDIDLNDNDLEKKTTFFAFTSSTGSSRYKINWNN